MQMDRCHFWLAKFQNGEQIEEYFSERYGDDDDDLPISQFASDQGETFYDHDWVYFEPIGQGNLEKILHDSKVPEVTGKIILEFAGKLDFEANTLIVADQGEFEDPVSLETDSYRLAYVGCHVLHG